MRPPASCIIHLNARRLRTAGAVRRPTNIEAMVGMPCTRAGTGRSAARALLWAAGVVAGGGGSAHAFARRGAPPRRPPLPPPSPARLAATVDGSAGAAGGAGAWRAKAAAFRKDPGAAAEEGAGSDKKLNVAFVVSVSFLCVSFVTLPAPPTANVPWVFDRPEMP